MKHTIKTYEYKRIEKTATEIEIPEETIYCFQTGIRRAVKIEPQWTTWNKENYQKDEEVWNLKITCVYNSFECKIEQYTIQVSQLEDNINRGKDSYSIPNLLLHRDFNLRTKEQFEADLKIALDKITGVTED
jgi:hypothetical protein